MTLRITAVAAGAIVLCGCTTLVTVKPAPTKDEGLTYSLPATYLLVTPSADGTVTYQWLYLPDERYRYTVKASGFLSKYSLDVQRQNGLLKQVGASSDTTGVTSQLAKALGTIAANSAKSSGQNSNKAGGNAGGGNPGGGNPGGGNPGGGNPGGGKPGGGNPGGGNPGGGNPGGGNPGGGNPGGGNPGGGNPGGGNPGGGNPGGGNPGGGNPGGGNPGGGNPGGGNPGGGNPGGGNPGGGNPGGGNQGPKIEPGAVAAAYGPVLFRIDPTADGFTATPVNFPDVQAHGVGGVIPSQASSYQQLFETNALSHVVILSAQDNNATSVIVTANYPLATIQQATIKDTAGKVVVDNSKVTSTLVAGSLMFAISWTKALPPGKYTASVSYLEPQKNNAESGTFTFAVVSAN